MINFINIQYTMDSRTLKNYQTSDVTLLLFVWGGGVTVFVECGLSGG